MTLRQLIFASLFLATPALADTVTLTIENDAGMVTTREGYTQTECDATALLLNGSKIQDCQNCITGLTLGNSGTYFIGGQPLSTPPHTSKLTKAQCMRPTQGTKP